VGDGAPDDDGLKIREANPWARYKLDIVECYLPAFSKACQAARQHHVVDAFAGPGVNVFRDDGERRWGTPLMALRTAPPFTRVLAMDTDDASLAALRTRTEPFGARAVVRAGDANTDLLPAMRETLEDWAPVLVVLDPEGTELDFRTLESVARFRRGKTKAELLVLLATHTGFLRLLWEEVPEWAAERMDRLYGTDRWRDIHRQRREGTIDTDTATSRYVALYADQLRQRCGYNHVLDREIREHGRTGKLGYFLLFASDHPGGQRIMEHCFDDRFGEEQQPPLFRYRRSRLEE
jgi:three-Cys-motif partner protein